MTCFTDVDVAHSIGAPPPARWSLRVPASVVSNEVSARDVGLLDLLEHRFETPQSRGKAFERLMQQAFRRHPDVYGPQRFKNVWRWMEWPDRQAHGYGGDVGIDLVAEQTESAGGGLCAIQTKAHMEARIDKKAVDSFISASAGSAFSARLLVLTAPMTAQARTMIEQAVPRCEVLHRSDLESWPVNWVECLDDPERLRFAPRTRHTPKPFQREAVARGSQGLTKSMIEDGWCCRAERASPWYRCGSPRGWWDAVDGSCTWSRR